MYLKTFHFFGLHDLIKHYKSICVNLSFPYFEKGKGFNFLIAWLKIQYRNLIDFFSEYVGTWLGLAKIGVVPALINYNLKHKSLVHTVTVAKSKAIIYGVELAQGKNIFF